MIAPDRQPPPPEGDVRPAFYLLVAGAVLWLAVTAATAVVTYNAILERCQP